MSAAPLLRYQVYRHANRSLIDIEQAAGLETSLLELLSRLPGFSSTGSIQAHGDLHWQCSYRGGSFRLIHEQQAGWLLLPDSEHARITADITSLFDGSGRCQRLDPHGAVGAAPMNPAASRMQPSSPTSLRRIGRALFVASLLLYAISLCLPPFRVEAADPYPWPRGWQVLLMGWLGMSDGILAWLANPLLLATWLLAWRQRRMAAIVTGALALLLGLSFLLNDQISIDEAGHLGTLRHDGAGYWLWLASQAAGLLGGLTLRPGTLSRPRQ